MHPQKKLLILIIYLVAGGILSQFVSFVALTLYVGGWEAAEATLLQMGAAVPDPTLRSPLLLIQAVSSGFLFLAVPWAYFSYFGMQSSDLFPAAASRKWVPLLLAAVLAVVIFPFVAFTYEWNMSWTFPGMFGEWATEQEAHLKEFTMLIMRMDGVTDLCVVLFIVGIIPAVGEEVVFRGLLQPQFTRVFRNHHMGIWVTAIVFGLVHMQFFGLVPRILLGLVLGYLAYWSGSLVYSMVFHLVNNGGQVILSYIATRSDITAMEEQENPFPWVLTLASVLGAALLLHYYKRFFVSYELENRVQNRE